MIIFLALLRFFGWCFIWVFIIRFLSLTKCSSYLLLWTSNSFLRFALRTKPVTTWYTFQFGLQAINVICIVTRITQQHQLRISLPAAHLTFSVEDTLTPHNAVVQCCQMDEKLAKISRRHQALFPSFERCHNYFAISHFFLFVILLLQFFSLLFLFFPFKSLLPFFFILSKWFFHEFLSIGNALSNLQNSGSKLL